MNVENESLYARSTYMADPAACGYLVTSSAYANAVSTASSRAAVNAVQIAPPTSAPTSPTKA